MQFAAKALSLFCLLLTVISTAQSAKKLMLDDAEELFRKGNYVAAIPVLKNEIKKDPFNPGIRYKLGICYLNTNVNRKQALQVFEDLAKREKTDAELWLNLGKAYHLNWRFDDAIASFENYARLKPRHTEDVEHLIAQCKNAIELMKNPEKVSFQNLGRDINSGEPDYLPFIDKDETILLFTTRRKENFGGRRPENDGYRSSDIYQCTMKNGKWSPAKNLGRTVNSNLDEQIVGLRSDGLEMYVYLDHIESYGDLYVSGRNDSSLVFSKPKVMEQSINGEIELSGCMNEEGTIFIFSRKTRLSGNSDLYVSHLLPNGKWGSPQLLPDVINTPYNEDMPFISYDGLTLYFASEGHNSMGGYDLFKSSWDQEAMTFSKPENLGYPVNSPEDEKSICVTRDNKLAYMSAFRHDGFGDLDIYRLKFAEEDPVNVIYTGQFILGDTASPPPKKYEIRITVTNSKTEEEFIFVPHSKTGRYVMALPAGDYKLVTYCKGYARHKEDLRVSDMGKINMERHKDFRLRKLKPKQ